MDTVRFVLCATLVASAIPAYAGGGGSGSLVLGAVYEAVTASAYTCEHPREGDSWQRGERLYTRYRRPCTNGTSLVWLDSIELRRSEQVDEMQLTLDREACRPQDVLAILQSGFERDGQTCQLSDAGGVCSGPSRMWRRRLGWQLRVSRTLYSCRVSVTER